MSKIKITIAEPSVIIRGGLLAHLPRQSDFGLEIHEIADIAQLRSSLAWQKPDILIISPLYAGIFSLSALRRDAGNKQMKCVAINYSLPSVAALSAYDEVISVSDSAEAIRDKISRLARSFIQPAAESKEGSLSTREKEVVVYVVKGLTNKQIAEQMSLSAHTVITHRRNISSKLGIHSTAGLTIYAIVNNLVELGEIKETFKQEE